MLSLPPSVRVFLCLDNTDMRKGIDGLAALVENRLRHDAFSGHLFCFFNRARDKVKVLYWDTTGFCLYLKRLEKGHFHLTGFTEESAVSPTTLQLILEGLELAQAKQLPRFERLKKVA
jgi:transposase